MATTNHLGITLVDQSQSQKEVTVNQAFVCIDALMNSGAKSRVTNTPPGSPASGDLYIVGSSPTGAWSGKALMLAYFNQVWNFITPGTGMLLRVNDESLTYTYNGTSWVTTGTGTVTSASVVSANGFSGSIATATTTPAITLGTSVTGMVKGNGTALSAATVGTDYSVGTSALGTGIVKSTTGTGALTIAVAADFPTLNQNTTGSSASCTGNAATVTTNANLTGDVTSVGNATTLALGVVHGWTAQQYAAASALTAGTTVSWNLNTAQAATLTAAQNFTLSNPTNMQAGATYTLVITQDATGSRVITWGSAYKFSGGSKFVLSTAAGAIDIISFYSDGTNMYAVGQAAFS